MRRVLLYVITYLVVSTVDIVGHAPTLCFIAMDYLRVLYSTHHAITMVYATHIMLSAFTML